MIKTFISKVGGGKSLCMIAEAAAQENKRVAFITFEMRAYDIVKRLDGLKPKTKSFFIYTPGNWVNSDTWLYEKISNLRNEFDIICIDAIDIVPNLDLKKLDNLCFEFETDRCTELWASKHIGYNPNIDNDSEDFVTVKQVCRRYKNPLIGSTSFVKAVDLEKKEIKVYNLSNIFKN